MRKFGETAYLAGREVPACLDTGQWTSWAREKSYRVIGLNRLSGSHDHRARKESQKESRKESRKDTGGPGRRGARPAVVLASSLYLTAGHIETPAPASSRSKPCGKSSPALPPVVSHILALAASPLHRRTPKEAKIHTDSQVNKPPTSCQLPSSPRKEKGGE